MLRALPSLAVVALLAGPAFAGGLTLTVNSELDLPDADAKDGVCDADLEVEGQQITLRAAINHANLVPGPDTIELPPGVYKLTIKGAHEDGGGTGDLDINDDLLIEGEDLEFTIVDGKKCKDRVFEVAKGVAAQLAGFTIRNGKAPTDEEDDEEGGGIESEGDLTLQNMLVTKCKTGVADGGGLAQSGGSVLIEDCIFTKNKAKDDGAGADIANSEATLTRVSFTKNKAKGTGGGLEVSPAEATVTNCTFSANSATAGGGALSVKEGSAITLTNCTLAKNKSKIGSGIFEQVDEKLEDVIELANCIVSNKATTNYDGDGLTSLGGNLDTGTTCGFSLGNDQNEADARLQKLSNTDEPPVLRLKPDSPCIDAADDKLAPATDQLGQARVDVPDVGTSIADIGSMEFVPEG